MTKKKTTKKKTTANEKMTKWLVMVYINADDVLANFATDSLNQLRQAAAKVAAPGSDIAVRALFNPTGRKGPTRFFSCNSPPLSPAPSDALDHSAALALVLHSLIVLHSR